MYLCNNNRSLLMFVKNYHEKTCKILTLVNISTLSQSFALYILCSGFRRQRKDIEMGSGKQKLSELVSDSGDKQNGNKVMTRYICLSITLCCYVTPSLFRIWTLELPLHVLNRWLVIETPYSISCDSNRFDRLGSISRAYICQCKSDVSSVCHNIAWTVGVL